MPASNNSEPSAVAARLIDRALGLARAEVALVLVHSREVAVRALTALLATIVAGAFAQLAVVLLILSPILVKVVPIENFILAVVLPLVVALVCALVALLSWRHVHRIVHVRSTPVKMTAERNGAVPPSGAIVLAERISQ